jgi:hypothetical protein
MPDTLGDFMVGVGKSDVVKAAIERESKRRAKRQRALILEYIAKRDREKMKLEFMLADKRVEKAVRYGHEIETKPRPIVGDRGNPYR